MTDIIRSYDLSEYSFQAYIKVCAKQFRKCLSSQQVQKEATRVWHGVEDVLYGNGKEIMWYRHSWINIEEWKKGKRKLENCPLEKLK